MEELGNAIIAFVVGVTLIALGSIPILFAVLKGKKASDEAFEKNPHGKKPPIMVDPEKVIFPGILLLFGIAVTVASGFGS